MTALDIVEITHSILETCSRMSAISIREQLDIVKITCAILETWSRMSVISIRGHLDQGSQTRSPWVICGPRDDILGPATL